MPKWRSKTPFVLVPNTSDATFKDVVRGAQCACRVAHQMQHTPMAPLLYFMTFLSPGELQTELDQLALRWLDICDRIWLKFPDDNKDDVLDSFSYEVLYANLHAAARRPVYLLHPLSSDYNGYVPVAMGHDTILELLNMNLVVGLTASCR